MTLCRVCMTPGQEELMHLLPAAPGEPAWYVCRVCMPAVQATVAAEMDKVMLGRAFFRVALGGCVIALLAVALC